nr:TPA_asm: m20 iORF RNA 3 [Murid betaherpesvirus 1]DBA07936.1 TPA_asm: m20 iORF RNA 3 [Murid betaherpesvirus 1]
MSLGKTERIRDSRALPGSGFSSGPCWAPAR